MGKKTSSSKSAPRSKKAISKHTIVKQPRKPKSESHPENENIVNFTPAEQSKILALYSFLKNDFRKAALDSTVEFFGKELEQLFGAEVIASEPTMKVKFEGGSNSKAAKKAEAERLAKEAEEKMRLAAEAAKKAAELKAVV